MKSSVAARQSGEVTVDMTDSRSIEAMFESVGKQYFLETASRF
jgi:hypothetical protein